eukprot:TRINITY_DN6499_c0_g1_i1.p1 TRINITY_DN6499_c0_g1~~TRINITY_DN6499_c0_g1_i1.p1  ORF type:complete len:483 (+),score=130.99 TRINITY_DN6499_c0_g1_i1:71-1450(+)
MSLLASSFGGRVVALTVARSVVRSFATGTSSASSSVSNNPRFPPPPTNTNTPPSVFDYRRLANRSKWGPPREEDPEYIVLNDDTKLGEDIELNWTINRYQITPRVEAFRNLHTRGLRMFAKGTLDANKALHISAAAPKTHDTFVLGLKAPEGKPAPEGVKTVTNDQLKTLFREVRRYLSEVDQIFVHDGLVGSEKARIFTEDASVALALNQLVPTTPLGNVEDFTHALTVYIVPTLPASKIASLKLGNNFTLIDVERNNVFVVGTPSISAVRDALADVASHQNVASGLVLSGAGLVSGNRSVLVLSKDNSFLSTALSTDLSQSLFAGNKVAWTKDGLVRLFNGVSYSGNTFQTGDLVENKNQITKAVSYSQASVAPHPSVVVFYGEDIPNISEGVSKLSNKQALTNAASLLQSSPFGDNGQSSRFEELLKESKAEVILFNKKSGSSAADVAAKIKSLLQ